MIKNPLAAIFTVALFSSAAVPVYAETVKITLLGVGDVYNFDTGKSRGGVARLNALARAEKAANPNTIYVFDGDMLSPSLLSGLDHGDNMIALTNLVPFDMAVPGNHEFDFGPGNFLAKVAASKYPWAALNITTADGRPLAGVGGVMMKNLSGVKVALVPIAQESSPEVSSTGDLKFQDAVKTAIAAAIQARKEGADLVVGVVQAPRSQDMAMIASKAFDVLFSGDDHDLAMQYNGITAYVETSIDANYLVPIDLNVTIDVKDGKRSVKWEPTFRFVDTATLQPDAETQLQVDVYRTELAKDLDVAIGVTQGPLDSRRSVVRSEEAAIGNLIADAMRKATGADLAMINGGGIRGDKQYDAGAKLTRKDVLTELPFGNKTVLIDLTGQQVWDALENGFSQIEDGAGRFPQLSGMVVTADKTKPAGARLVSVQVAGRPLNLNAHYKLATNDFMLNGGDGYAAFEGSKVLVNAANGKLMANDVLAYVKDMGGVNAQVEGRIILK